MSADRPLRARLRRALARLPRTTAEVCRPPANGAGEAARVGRVGGYLMAKRRGGWSAALPGQLGGAFGGECLLAVYPERLPEVRPGDVLSWEGGRRRVLAVEDKGGWYAIYRLDAR